MIDLLIDEEKSECWWFASIFYLLFHLRLELPLLCVMLCVEDIDVNLIANLGREVEEREMLA